MGSFFGDSPVAARMPSVIAGVIAVVFVYLAAVPLIGRPAALVAAAIHALSPFLVAYSQEARQYSLLSCASAASFAALIRLLRGQRHSRYRIPDSRDPDPLYPLGRHLRAVGADAVRRGSDRRRPNRTMASGAWRAGARARRVPPWAVFTARQYRGLGGVFWVPRRRLCSLVETAYE